MSNEHTDGSRSGGEAVADDAVPQAQLCFNYLRQLKDNIGAVDQTTAGQALVMIFDDILLHADRLLSIIESQTSLRQPTQSDALLDGDAQTITYLLGVRHGREDERAKLEQPTPELREAAARGLMLHHDIDPDVFIGMHGGFDHWLDAADAALTAIAAHLRKA